jgi:hypothetical protein
MSVKLALTWEERKSILDKFHNSLTPGEQRNALKWISTTHPRDGINAEGAIEGRTLTWALSGFPMEIIALYLQDFDPDTFDDAAEEACMPVDVELGKLIPADRTAENAVGEFQGIMLMADILPRLLVLQRASQWEEK